VASIGIARRGPIVPGLYWLFRSACGPVAQLGARVNRTHEVRGSNPLGSTKLPSLHNADPHNADSHHAVLRKQLYLYRAVGDILDPEAWAAPVARLVSTK
jgi:hypothetical protein